VATCRETIAGPIVDTVGAGDTFQAALLAWGHHRGALGQTLSASDAASLLGFATRTAGLNCLHPGCQPPTLGELESAPL
jgi:fructokinase